jgi:hypothetical protein
VRVYAHVCVLVCIIWFKSRSRTPHVAFEHALGVAHSVAVETTQHYMLKEVLRSSQSLILTAFPMNMHDG